MAMHPLQTHQRQIHLDFHTSPHIPDVASEFDAREFARTFKRAHVNSVTVFAKCHHGMSYYPTKTGTRHPALRGRDLLGEMVEALHHEGIRAPIYTTVAWEEDVARRFPEWLQLKEDGTFARWADPNGSKVYPGAWWFNNFLHPDYLEYMEAHVRELLGNYEVDGLFFDIVFFHERACWSPSSVKFREKHGLTGRDAATQARFECAAQSEFARHFTRLIRGVNRKATIFYNSSIPIWTDGNGGAHARHESQTHWEVESLPSGHWGYFHFPRLGRSLEKWGKPWLGMTGRFQRMWGDFGGLKPVPALEYESFRSQALGGGNSVGDQLPPRGALDLGAYNLIGEVYAQWEMAEPFYAGSKQLAQVAIVAPGGAGLEPALSDKALEGAIQMCEEAHYEAAVVDDTADLGDFDLVILPDMVSLTATLAKRLSLFLKNGGKLILSDQSGFAADGRSKISGLPLRRLGKIDLEPTYWRARSSFSPALARSDRVVYLPGSVVNASGRGFRVAVDRVLPYFPRTDLTFCSHFQTPPQANAERLPAVVLGRNFAYFADPIFREYRQYGNIAVRDGWREAMRGLVGAARFGDGLPSTILSVPRRRSSDLIITLLHYIPVRKALEVDMIEERMSFAGEALSLPGTATSVIDFESGMGLEQNSDGQFILPAKKGRLLLEVPGFFRK